MLGGVAIKRKGSVTRRKQIAASAARLIVDLGGEHVTIKNIALGIGLSEAAIYRHFPNKRAIYSFLIEYAGKMLAEDLTYAEKRRARGPVNPDFIVESHLSNVIKRRGIFFQVFTEVISMGDSQLNKEAFNAISNYIACVTRLIEMSATSRYFKRGGDPSSSAFIFYSLLQFLINTWILSGYSFDLKNRFNHVWFKCGITQQDYKVGS